jgi:uncharacterized protein (DUF2267 family)
MTPPTEYQQAREHWAAFLEDVRDACQFSSTNPAYTTAQGVFQAFRRRLALGEAIRFADALPGLLRALFVADWDPDEPRRPFAARDALLDEVRGLRPNHNFTPDGAIEHVAWAVGRRVDRTAFAHALAALPADAAAFWAVNGDASERQAAEWRAIRAAETRPIPRAPDDVRSVWAGTDGDA